jgi:hypothetical protein
MDSCILLEAGLSIPLFSASPAVSADEQLGKDQIDGGTLRQHPGYARRTRVSKKRTQPKRSFHAHDLGTPSDDFQGGLAQTQPKTSEYQLCLICYPHGKTILLAGTRTVRLAYTGR